MKFNIKDKPIEKMSIEMENKSDLNINLVDGKQTSSDVLPEADKSFSFSGQDFADPSFSLDVFLKINRSKVSLEQLKDDLNSYLKVLKTSMIELINEDYNDFVNLSTNLMGFDKAINNLSQPLIQLRDQSIKIEEQFGDRISQLDNHLKRLQSIRQNKSQTNKIISLMDGIRRAEDWFDLYKNNDNSCDSERQDFTSLEKIALIVIQMKVHLKCIDSDIPLVKQQIMPRFESLSDSLYRILESGFFTAITDNETTELNTILRIYSLNGRHSELENMFKQKVVKPFMNEVICDTFLEKYGTHRFFQEILQFIDLKCQPLIGLKDTNYSFMINSVWSEVSDCLIVSTSSLFSAGNPDDFHSQYSVTIEFIDSFVIKSQIKRSDLENESNYKELMNKFNIEVYFHIRFQQIATKFESALEEHAFDVNIDDRNDLKYFVTQTIYNCLTMCWNRQFVYISALFSSFWKITVQLFSRYSFWLENLKESDIKASQNETTVQNNGFQNKTLLLGLLINDFEIFINKSKDFFKSNISVLKPLKVSSNELQQSFDEIIESIERKGISNVVTLIKHSIITECDLILKRVNDLPRLYRKTNKEMPTKASNYIFNCIDLIASITCNEKQVWRSEWTRSILNEMTAHFKQFTSEVLTSVQKIEDSLKRLKKTKAGNQLNQTKSNSINNNMSDDNKIRLQICYDIEEYAKQIEVKLKIDNKSIDSLLDLMELSNATKNLIN